MRAIHRARDAAHDGAQPEQLAEAVPTALAWQGRIDVLINNAGISQRGRAADSEMSVVRRIMEVNYFGLVDLTIRVLPAMRAQGRGHIVNISSVAGYVSTPLRSTYCASKHAVRSWSDSLRSELHGEDIAVTVVVPGYVATEISAQALQEDGQSKGQSDSDTAKGLTVEEAVKVIMRGLVARRREVWVGGPEVYAIYLQRWFPGVVARLIHRAVPK